MPQHLMQMTSNAEPPSHHCNVTIACCSAGGLAPGLQCFVAASSTLQSGMRPLLSILHRHPSSWHLKHLRAAGQSSSWLFGSQLHATVQQVLSEPLGMKLCMFWVR